MAKRHKIILVALTLFLNIVTCYLVAGFFNKRLKKFDSYSVSELSSLAVNKYYFIIGVNLLFCTALYLLLTIRFKQNRFISLLLCMTVFLLSYFFSKVYL